MAYARELVMARRSDGTPKPRLFAVIPGDAKPDTSAPSEPIVLALPVAHALQKANLAEAVLTLRQPPADWVNFLVNLDDLLREGPVLQAVSSPGAF